MSGHVSDIDDMLLVVFGAFRRAFERDLLLLLCHGGAWLRDGETQAYSRKRACSFHPQTPSIVDVCIKHFASASALRKSSGGIVLVGPKVRVDREKIKRFQRVDHIVVAPSESMAGPVLADDEKTTNLL
jgi:hypothetical protein